MMTSESQVKVNQALPIENNVVKASEDDTDSQNYDKVMKDINRGVLRQERSASEILAG